jgi:hypothetical protein
MIERAVQPIGNYAFESFDFSESLAYQFKNDVPAASSRQPFSKTKRKDFQSISKLQLRKSLIYFEVLEQIEALVENESEEVQSNWYSTKPIQRDDKFLSELAKKLNFSDRQIDFIFEMGTTF